MGEAISDPYDEQRIPTENVPRYTRLGRTDVELGTMPVKMCCWYSIPDEGVMIPRQSRPTSFNLRPGHQKALKCDFSAAW